MDAQKVMIVVVVAVPQQQNIPEQIHQANHLHLFQHPYQVQGLQVGQLINR